MCHHRGYPLKEVDWDQKAEELREQDPEAAEPDPEPEPEETPTVEADD